MAKIKKYDVHAIGRRKSSVARVYVVKGTGTIKVNNRDLKDYFPLGTQRFVIHQPLNLTKNTEKFDLNVNVVGGGTTGQSEAIRLGISRALCKLDPSNRDALKKAGFLTRDAREVERKKYGKAGARRSFQFSKR